MLNKINLDIKNAMRSKDTVTRDILRGIVTKSKNLAKERDVESKDVLNSEVELCIQRQIKQNKDSISFLKEGGRDTLKEEKEIEILMGYLPKQMSKEEMEVLVKGIVSKIPEEKRTSKSRGLVMKELSQYKNVLDMKEAGNFAGSLLN